MFLCTWSANCVYTLSIIPASSSGSQQNFNVSDSSEGSTEFSSWLGRDCTCSSCWKQIKGENAHCIYLRLCEADCALKTDSQAGVELFAPHAVFVSAAVIK